MIVLLAPMLVCVAIAVAWRHERRRGRRLAIALGDVVAERDAGQRIARLAGLDLRDAALRLHGLAGAPLPRDADPDAAAKLASIAERCRMLADDLGAAGLALAAPGLREEPIDLLDCARQAADAVAATIAPGRRRFRLPSEPARECVWADRRAVRQVLGRVLAEAALNTGQDDSISLSLRDEGGALVLVIADEGIGLAGAAPADPAVAGRDSRGIGAPLALARALMQAHGGGLDVEGAAGAGTRVSLVFPAARRRRMAAEPPGSATRATLPSCVRLPSA